MTLLILLAVSGKTLIIIINVIWVFFAILFWFAPPSNRYRKDFTVVEKIVPIK